MTLKITFELKDDDLEYFVTQMRKAQDSVRSADDEDIIHAAREVLKESRSKDLPEYIAARMQSLDTLIAILKDGEWPLEDDERRDILGGLAYFSDPEDIIPDHIPGLGFLDDAIILELIFRDLRHPIQAYQDYAAFRASAAIHYPTDDAAQRAERIERRRDELLERSRRRRERDAT
jgi:uncharacterized membrane protein YkvA (DUF1232 family)